MDFSRLLLLTVFFLSWIASASAYSSSRVFLRSRNRLESSFLTRNKSKLLPHAPFFAKEKTTLFTSLSGDGTKVETSWNTNLRRTMAAIASAGLVETAYLTFAKLSSSQLLLCSSNEQGSASSCGSVLSGPYSVIPGTNIPLAFVGMIAYGVVVVLALAPTLASSKNTLEKNDMMNRVLLVSVTSAMGVFSVFLMSLLFFVLHQSCPYCLASAGFSISLAALSWLGDIAPLETPQRAQQTILASVSTSLVTVVAALTLFFSVNTEAATAFNSGAGSSATVPGQKLLRGPYSPPAITTTSSARAIEVARNLQTLDTRFYGAYWCSHCFEQKSVMGKEAMHLIPYVECSLDGENAQMKVCREKKIPGYPTWEIAGKLYSGEQSLDDLEEIIEKAKSK